MSNNINYAAVAVGASAVQVVAANGLRDNVIVHNNHASQILYLGDDSSVTTANGLPVPAGQKVTLEGYTGPVYGIASGAATDTRYLECV
jgi:hypothetical protein